MVKFWKYYKYYFCTLWKRPLVWLLTGGMVYAQYEQTWQIQAMIYLGFVLLLPLAISCERVRANYELEDIASDLAKREARRAYKGDPDPDPSESSGGEEEGTVNAGMDGDASQQGDASPSDRLPETFNETERKWTDS